MDMMTKTYDRYDGMSWYKYNTTIFFAL